MYVACSTLCFARFPLDRALRIINELEFRKVDIAIGEDGPHLKLREVAEDVTLAAQRIRIGPSLSPAAFTVDLGTTGSDEELNQIKAVCKLARISAVPVMTIPASRIGTPLEKEIGRLTRLNSLVKTEGLVLSLHTRIGTLTETPMMSRELCEQVPGLGLTLDPSHFISGPHQGGSYDELFPYVRHVHLRDTSRAPGKFQVRIGQGEIEYGRIITQLQRCRYDRLLTVAVHDIPDAPFAMDAEVRKLKFLLESLV